MNGLGKIALTILLTGNVSANAQLFIDLPDVILNAEQAGQTFDVYVQNTGASVDVTGLSFGILVEDGGPDVGGSTLGPKISGVDIVSAGLLFAANNTGQSGGSVGSQGFNRGTLAGSGSVAVAANDFSKLATVTVDTTGFSSGSFSMTLDAAPVTDPTLFFISSGTYQPTLSGGTLTVVPEPSDFAAAAALGLFAFAVCRRLRASPCAVD